MKMIITSLIATCFLVSGLATAAEIGYKKSIGRDDLWISLDGEITAGDAEKLRQKLLDNRWNAIWLSGITLNSVGGSVGEAIKIAGLIELAGLPVQVAPGDLCASSCFLVYAAAPYRASSGHLAVHRPFFDMEAIKAKDLSESEINHRSAISFVRNYLQERAIPDQIIEKMMRLSSVDSYVLSDLEVGLMGAASPAMAEYMFQICKLPIKNLTNDDIGSARACRDSYLRQSRIRFIFGPEHAVAEESLKKLDAKLRSAYANQERSVANRMFLRATTVVNTRPPSEWLKSIE